MSSAGMPACSGIAYGGSASIAISVRSESPVRHHKLKRERELYGFKLQNWAMPWCPGPGCTKHSSHGRNAKCAGNTGVQLMSLPRGTQSTDVSPAPHYKCCAPLTADHEVGVAGFDGVRPRRPQAVRHLHLPFALLGDRVIIQT